MAYPQRTDREKTREIDKTVYTFPEATCSSCGQKWKLTVEFQPGETVKTRTITCSECGATTTITLQRHAPSQFTAR